jgi:glycosyltransferase involved in cell wall biosynthesis
MPRIAHLGCFFPAFDEEENIGPLLDEAMATLPALAEQVEVVVVDDGSRDRTSEVVAERARHHPEIRLVRHESNLGYGHALRSGLEATGGEVVALVDGDRQFRMSDLRLLAEALDGADVVAGYRIRRADRRHRLLIAGVYDAVLRAALGLRIHDVDCGFKLFRRAVVDEVTPKLESRSAFISAELLLRAGHAGFRITEVGVPHHPRTAGRSKGATPTVVARTVREILRLRRSLARPRRSTAGRR